MRNLIVIFTIMVSFAFPAYAQSACPVLSDVITGLKIVTDIPVSSIPAAIFDIDNNKQVGLPEVVYMLQIISGQRECPAYPVVGTNQTLFYNNAGEITAPAPGQPYYGQAAFHPGNIPSYTDNGETITDNVTGLMWVKARGSKVTWSDAVAGASTNRTAGYSDWRMPTIKELYSLILFSGVNGPDNTNIEGYIPYIDINYFGFAYGPGGSTNVGERIIDCQDWSANKYVSTVMGNQIAIFGVNFADGRIKGYNEFVPFSGEGNELYVRYVRGNTGYGENNFKDNGDSTVTDLATNLMWSKDDSKTELDWLEALAWVQTQNAANYLGHNDWRLPDAKELQSIVDYTRSPSTTNSPAVDVNFFNTTSITNEAGQTDYPYFWTGSVLLDGGPFPSGIYISFGRAMGYMNNSWTDVHGAGSQKSDIMVGDPAKYPTGRGPQGDAVRIYNYVRLVRNMEN
ncbi:DUF1566 [Desulfonema limicola]|uniref:DUF1566 n=1 Tax=Desulfonema limicola TaxID=45656 RepID=A0A975B8I2_9BACT|nr:DUF1566 domain-containing protein [Desulfonema limicola]QTA80808.1 DUF1566 [Desulfonema limicola]